MPSRATRAAGTRRETCASCTGGVIIGIISRSDTKRQRLEPCAGQLARTVLRGGGRSNAISLPDYVYGRRKCEAVPGEPPTTVNRRVALAEWDIVVPNVYPAYLTYDAYQANRRALRGNLYNFARKGDGAPREGLAPLAGLVVCGRCGRRMAVSYGSAYHSYHCRRAQAEYGDPQCQSCPM